MSFVEYISNLSAKWLASKVPNNYPSVEDQIEVYQYGWMVIWGALVKIVLLLTISFLLGVLTSAIILTITFSSFRILGGGGFHFDSYNKCITASLIQFIGATLIVKYTYQYWSQLNIITLFTLTTLMGLYIIYRYVPRDTPNKPITELEEIGKFKRWSLLYLVIWSIIMIIFLLLNFNLIVISSCFGLLLELFSISKLGYTTFEKINSINCQINN